MTNKDNLYRDDFEGQIGKQVADFLPAPHQLIKKQKMQRITMEIPAETVSFFKDKASQHGASYQAMIRELLTHYAQNYNK